MRKILTKSDLFDKVPHLVDICAIAMLAIGDNPILVSFIKDHLDYTDEEINQFKEELKGFFENEEER